jgi:hypothetical protein
LIACGVRVSPFKSGGQESNCIPDIKICWVLCLGQHHDVVVIDIIIQSLQMANFDIVWKFWSSGWYGTVYIWLSVDQNQNSIWLPQVSFQQKIKDLPFDQRISSAVIIVSIGILLGSRACYMDGF